MDSLPTWMQIAPLNLDYWLDIYTNAMVNNEVDSLPLPLIKFIDENPDLQHILFDKDTSFKEKLSPETGNSDER